MAAAVLMLLVSLLLIKNHNQAIAIFPIVLAIYVPISYYTDLWLYRRRQRNKAARGEQSKREDAR
jgi:phosphoglycerol transferase MdoB-like AlkP superfamily enzyme